jgi:hypothetical protein
LIALDKVQVMKNTNAKVEGSVNSDAIKEFGEKISANLRGVNLTLKSRINTRWGVSIDWSSGRMILQDQA